MLILGLASLLLEWYVVKLILELGHYREWENSKKE